MPPARKQNTIYPRKRTMGSRALAKGCFTNGNGVKIVHVCGKGLRFRATSSVPLTNYKSRAVCKRVYGGITRGWSLRVGRGIGCETGGFRYNEKTIIEQLTFGAKICYNSLQ